MAVPLRRVQGRPARQAPQFRQDGVDPSPVVEADERQPELPPTRDAQNTLCLQESPGRARSTDHLGSTPNKPRRNVDQGGHEEIGCGACSCNPHEPPFEAGSLEVAQHAPTPVRIRAARPRMWCSSTYCAVSMGHHTTSPSQAPSAPWRLTRRLLGASRAPGRRRVTQPPRGEAGQEVPGSRWHGGQQPASQGLPSSLVLPPTGVPRPAQLPDPAEDPPEADDEPTHGLVGPAPGGLVTGSRDRADDRSGRHRATRETQTSSSRCLHRRADPTVRSRTAGLSRKRR